MDLIEPNRGRARSRSTSPSALERSLGALLLVGCSLIAAAPLAAQTAVTEVVDAVEDAVVDVTVYFDRPPGQARPAGAPEFVSVVRPSSGVLISASGLVLTNAHLVAEVPDGPLGEDPEYWLVVTRSNGIPYEATVVARDERTDLALLQLDVPSGRQLPALPLASLEGRQVGERVVALGFTSGELHAFAGSLAIAQAPVRLREALLEPNEIVNSDARFHATLDGAPLLDTRGAVLGLHNSSHIAVLPPGFHQDPDSEEEPPPSTDYAVIVSADAVRASFAEHLEGVDLPELPLDAPVTDAACDAIERIAPSVVSVWTADPEARPSHAAEGDPQCQRVGERLGSGVVVDAAGLVLTSSDLFEGDDTDADVRLADGTTYPAQVLELSRLRNTALLQVALPEGTTLPAATLAEAILPGEFVVAVGRPYVDQLVTSAGVLSATEREQRVQVASWIHPGHWGGALVDRHGHLLGIAVDQPASMRSAFEESYLGFAAPIESNRETYASWWPVAEVGAEPGFGDRENAVSRVVAATRSSLINVLVSRAAPREATGFDPFAEDEGGDDFVPLGQGSGVIIHESGLALSNWHVVDAAMRRDGSQADDHQVKVSLPDGREFQVQVLSTSRDDDLALLKIELPPGETVVPVELGNSEDLEVGDVVIAIGNPLGLANSASAGIVSAVDIDAQIRGRLFPYEDLLVTDAAINPGNSGGALLDTEGRLVGINSAGRTGAGMAIPVNRAREVFSGKLLSAEKLRSAYLGFKVREASEGLVVTEVDDHGPAAPAGLERGDVLLGMGEREVTTEIAFAQVQLAARPGTPLPLRVRRGAEELQAEVVPLSHAAWTIFRQCGVQVAEVDFARESDLVRAAGVALHRAYTGDDQATPSSLMGGALRVTQLRPHEDHPLDLQAGDLLLGMTTVVRGLEADSYQLTRFESVADLARATAPLATRDGQSRTFWFLRGDQVFEHELFLKRAR